MKLVNANLNEALGYIVLEIEVPLLKDKAWLVVWVTKMKTQS
jgi:hypothetical protein